MNYKKIIVALAGIYVAGAGHAAGNVVKIGVLTDQSGYSADLAGPGSVAAVKLAVEDFGGKVNGMPIEVVIADHLNKVDIASSIARKWLESEGVDVIADVPNSSISLATSGIVKQANKVFLAVTGATTRLTNEDCSPNTVQWTTDSWAVANALTSAVLRNGGKTWSFLTADLAFGHDMEAKATEFLNAGGGKVVNSTRVPVNTTDYSSALLKAQGSGAKIIGLAVASGDANNAIKQGHEFGLKNSGINFAAMASFLTDIHSLGLNTAQGMYIVEPFYWNMNPETRKFSDRYAQRMNGRRPTPFQAGNYAATMHYLKAVAALKSNSDGAAVVRKMKEMATDDPLFGKGSIREDGRKIHPMYLFQVKSPAESKGSWDYYKLVDTIPADKAFQPLAQSKCSFIKK